MEITYEDKLKEMATESALEAAKDMFKHSPSMLDKTMKDWTQDEAKEFVSIICNGFWKDYGANKDHLVKSGVDTWQPAKMIWKNGNYVLDDGSFYEKGVDIDDEIPF